MHSFFTVKTMQFNGFSFCLCVRVFIVMVFIKPIHFYSKGLKFWTPPLFEIFISWKFLLGFICRKQFVSPIKKSRTTEKFKMLTPSILGLIRSHGKPFIRDKKNIKKCVKEHDKSNIKLNINTCIIKLQTFTSNIQE